MQLYHYNPETGEYLGSSIADLDPLETQAAGEPRYLIPAHATDQAPPEAPAGHAACWTGEAWVLIEDHRGKKYWKPDEYEPWHEGQEVTSIGPLPADVSLVKPEMPEDVRLERAAQAVRSERNRRLAACDYLMMPDYPLEEARRAEWEAYRQMLRDLPAQAGFPWSGLDDPTVPWPVEPVEG